MFKLYNLENRHENVKTGSTYSSGAVLPSQLRMKLSAHISLVTDSGILDFYNVIQNIQASRSHVTVHIYQQSSLFTGISYLHLYD